MDGSWAPLVGALVVGLCIGYVVRRAWATQQAAKAEEKTKEILGGAEEKAKKVVLEAEQKAADLLSEARKEEKERKQEVVNLEQRLIRREELLDKKLTAITSDEAAVKNKTEVLKKHEEELATLKQEAEAKLEKMSGLSATVAREELFKKIAGRHG